MRAVDISSAMEGTALSAGKNYDGPFPDVLNPGLADLIIFSPDANSGPAGHGERRLCVSGASHAHVASIGGSGNEECIRFYPLSPLDGRLRSAFRPARDGHADRGARPLSALRYRDERRGQ